jgi:hypothetical protein
MGLQANQSFHSLVGSADCWVPAVYQSCSFTPHQFVEFLLGPSSCAGAAP